ncbi:MAG: hypothetical protein OK439_04025 [Thaumarchaeota archaeon]|nr:hypothetical protein [Nitrososphaerota archaeon]
MIVRESDPKASTPNFKLWIPYLLLLIVRVGFLAWYPEQVLNAITGFNSSQGSFIGSDGRSQIFIFSIAGGVISFVLMTISIMIQQKNDPKYLPIALLVAYICTISVTMWYEQIYANLWDLANHTSYWFTYYTEPGKLLQVLIDMSLLLVAYPWMKRANLKMVGVFSILTLVLFAGWFAIGYGFPTTSSLAYFFNGSSRICSQLAIAVSVLPQKSQKEKQAVRLTQLN